LFSLLEAFIAQECKKLNVREWKTVLLDTLTDGQATTVLHSLEANIDKQNPILVYNIDTYVAPATLKPNQFNGDGWIPCFPGQGDSWSFVRVDDQQRAIEVREKQRISPHATIGLYGFSSFDCFESLYQRYYANEANIESKERYIAPLYNQLIMDGGDVYMTSIPEDAVHPLGTPEEVEVFRHGHFAQSTI
jgi:hypothetical protein